MSHDLRSPIAGTIGAFKVIIDEFYEMPSQELLAFITEANNSLELSHMLIEELLDLHRFKTGVLKPKFSDVVLEDVLINVIAKTRLQTKEKNIQIQYSIPENISVYADENLIEEVFFNLISNAIKFSFTDGIIQVLITEEDRNTCIQIIDNGTGIADNMMPNLFNIAIKTSIPGTVGETGTGLGLPLVAQIIEAHNGDISVESEPEKGSRFTITLAKKREAT